MSAESAPVSRGPATSGDPAPDSAAAGASARPLPAPERLVFVGGLHRSGTTALARALAQHPDVSGLTATAVKEDEGQHLQDVYPAANRHGGPGRFAMASAAHLTETSPLVTPDNATRLLRAWAPHWDLDRRLLVEKSPPNLVMTRFLDALFPGSAQVVVLRHPIVVALSTRKWARKRTLLQLVEHNLRAYELFAQDRPRLPRVHVLRYEDLVTDPTGELGRVGEFLGLPSPMPTDAIKAGHSTRYEEQWQSYADGSWLRRRRRREIEALAAEPLARLGYLADDLSYAGPWPG